MNSALSSNEVKQMCTFSRCAGIIDKYEYLRLDYFSITTHTQFIKTLTMWAFSLWFLLLAYYLPNANSYFGNYYCEDGRDVLIHLFEWKHSEVARECEEFLADAGYCGVQVCF